MTIEHRWASNGGVRIHFIDTGERGPGLPLVFSPGVSEWADEYEEMACGFAPRRVVVMTLRGRGKSDAPATGYTYDHLLGDLLAVLDVAGLERAHLATFSRGTTPALGVVREQPGRVATLAIGDYRAEQIRMPASWAGAHMAGRWHGRPNAERMPHHVAERIYEEAVPMDFYGDLAAWGGPMLVVRGLREGGLVTAAALGAVPGGVPRVQVVDLPDSGHDIFRPDPMAYPRALAAFLATVEGEGAASA